MTPDDLRFAIMAGDSKSLSKAPGIGKKTAERITLELRDKLKVSEDELLGGSAGTAASTLVGESDFENSARDEAVAALVALGYNSTDSMKAVRKVLAASPEAGEDTEKLLKLALKEMF
jgi:Holliday junction DNA helicase RuvA